MWIRELKITFYASRNLLDYEHLLSLSSETKFTLILYFMSKELDSIGNYKIFDIKSIQDIVNQFIPNINRENLNKVLNVTNPTNEFLTEFIFCELKQKIKSLYKVSIKDNYFGKCTYKRNY